MITAHEARQLDPKVSIESNLQSIDGLIKNAAPEGKTSIRTYGINGCFGGSELYTSENNYPFLVKEVLKSLLEKGFKAEIHADEKQFVDIYLSVSWKQDEAIAKAKAS